MEDQVIAACEEQMNKKLKGLENDLKRVRTGRASVSLLDSVRVDYYGTPTPVNQIASVSTPDARTVLISPFEKKMLSDIERAIQIADIGVQPNNDGSVIRLPVPPLSEERRKEIAKSIKKIGEDTKVGIRKVRQDQNSKLKTLEKNKEINEDDSKKLQKKIQDCTDKFVKSVDETVKTKEAEVLSL